MSYYLRVEGVNLGNFVTDTNDLSTIRGGSLLLLDAMDLVEETIKHSLSSSSSVVDVGLKKLEAELQALNDKEQPNKSDNNKKKNLRKSIRIKKAKARQQDVPVAHAPITITKGASWGLFQLNVETDKAAIKIKQDVFSALNSSKDYKHATLVVDLHNNNGSGKYQLDRAKIQTLNRWQQMESPSLAIPSPDNEVCDFDKVRPANSADYLKEEGKHISCSVNRRRIYGRKNKQEFYYKTTGIADLTFTNDLNQISSDKNKGILNGKIAFIYIDGNKFGSIQKQSNSPSQQREFDLRIRTGRADVLRDILKQIKDRPGWIYPDPETHEKRIRLETLLWGGDEIIWVVPAWQGWWMLQTFYQLAQKHIKHPTRNHPLKHAAGLIYCHHNAPIKRIDTLARSLADFAKRGDHSKKNMVAYQVLESFDHAGTNLDKYMEDRIAGLGVPADLLANAEQMVEIQSLIRTLKSDEIDFPRRKIYQIIQEYRRNNIAKAEEYEMKLPENSQKPLNRLKTIVGGNHSYWLHLMDLWDYIPQNGEGADHV